MSVGDVPGGTLTTTNPPPVAAPNSPSASLTDGQRRIAAARLALLAEIDRRAETVGRECAVLQLAEAAVARSLPDHLRGAIIANSRGGAEGKRTLSYRSLYRWLRARDENPAHPLFALAPKAPARKALPPWAVSYTHLTLPTI